MSRKENIGAIPAGARRLLWLTAVFDVMVAAIMLAAGDWLDKTSRLTAVASLGGHHLVVLVLAATGFLALAIGAVLTDGYRTADRPQSALLSAAAVVSTVAIGGAFAAALLIVGAAFVVALLGRALIR